MNAMVAVTAVTIRIAPTERGNFAALEEVRGGRQHGADHEGQHDRQKEGFGEIEDGDYGDDEEADQREGHDLGAANDRRLLVAALGQRLADSVGMQAFSRQHTHNQFSPCKGK